MSFYQKNIALDQAYQLNSDLQNSELLKQGIFMLHKRGLRFPGLKKEDRVRVIEQEGQISVFKGKKEVPHLNFNKINSLDNIKISTPKLMVGFLTTALLVGGIMDLMSAATALNLKLQIFSWSQLTLESCIFELRKGIQSLIELGLSGFGVAELLKRIRSDRANINLANDAFDRFQKEKNKSPEA
jgi:hypothetical protein